MKKTKQSKAMKAYWADPLRGGQRKRPKNICISELSNQTSTGLYNIKYDKPEQWMSATTSNLMPTSVSNGLVGTKAFVKSFVVDQAKDISFLDDGSVVLRLA